MEFRAQRYYHIYNQGNNRKKIFFEQENYLFFLSKAQKLLQPELTVIAYCLMPNHFHFLVYTDYQQSEEEAQDNKLSIQLGSLLSSYTKAVNKRYNRSGSLFRTHTKAKYLVHKRDPARSYIPTCFHYIHQNPVRAALVDHLKDWPYSFYLDYAGYRNGNLPDIQQGMDLMEFKNQEQFKEKSQEALNPSAIQNIW